MMRAAYVIVIVIVAVALGCSGDTLTATQTTVVLGAEPAVRARVVKVQVVVRGFADRRGVDDREALDRTFLASAGELEWPTVIAITPKDGDATRLYEVVATGFDEAGFVAQSRAISGYQKNKHLALPLVLEDGCIEMQCGDGLTCVDAKCVSAEIDAATLMQFHESDYPPAELVQFGNDSGGPSGIEPTDGGGGGATTTGGTGVSDGGSGGTGGASGGGGISGSGGGAGGMPSADSGTPVVPGEAGAPCSVALPCSEPLACRVGLCAEPIDTACMEAARGGHGYALCPNSKNWTDARSACLAWGMDLAIIDDEGENLFVNGTITTTTVVESWIGLSTGAGMGTWYWVQPGGAVEGQKVWSGGTFFAYGDVFDGNPSTVGGKCGFLENTASRQPYWYQVPCTETRGFVCEDFR